MKVELVVIWMDGSRDVYEYDSVEEADRGARNIKMAFGGQVAWCGVREKW